MLSAISYELSAVSYAAPCYGTKLPEKFKFIAGLESYTIFERDLEDSQGTIKSQQELFGLSFGIFDWLSIDLKAGAGNIEQRPSGGGELDYNTNFAGGYGLRLKFLDRDKIKAVLGFQHISVHPDPARAGDIKHKAILDDWQVSLLASYAIGKVTPYIGTRWSRIDYIHWTGDKRKRVMSDSSESVGLITGIDIPITERIWVNLEGQFFDSEAVACRLNFDF